MRVQLEPALKAQLAELAQGMGREEDALIADAVALYVEDVQAARQELAHRIEDVDQGRVHPVPGEEAFRRLRERSRK